MANHDSYLIAAIKRDILYTITIVNLFPEGRALEFVQCPHSRDFVSLQEPNPGA